MTSNKKDQICTLLKGIETGDPESVTVVNESKYIQHNPLTSEGSEGLAKQFKRLSKFSPRVNIIRIFEDGDFVFAHTDYDFNVLEIGFEIFRFENGLAVEHWDNLQRKHSSPNPSGHTMIDGPTEATALDRTEINREFVQSFVDDVLINGQLDQLAHYIDAKKYTEHNPYMSDGLQALGAALSTNAKMRSYDKRHFIFAEGSFVLSVCEGSLDAAYCSFYDLYHVTDDKIVEHWDTVDLIPPRSEWKNENGKF